MNFADLSGAITMVAAVVGGPWALFQWRDTLAQRKREFRWKQAEAAYKLMDQVFDDEHTGDALLMIDGEKDEFEIAPGERVRVDAKAIERALGFDGHTTAVDRFIRHRFDSLLYDLERLEHSLEVGLVELSDITTPTSYYVERLAPFRERIVPYAQKIGFNRALNLLNRFSQWSVPLSKRTE